jgi:hypothetical protein
MKKLVLLIVIFIVFSVQIVAHGDDDIPETQDHQELNQFCSPGTRECATYTIPTWIYIIGGVAVLLAIVMTVIWSKRKKKQRKLKDLLGYWTIAIIILILLWGVSAFQNSEAEDGIVVCNDDGQCTISVHTHWYLEGNICGVEISLPSEEGELSQSHTHKEHNRAHFHDTLPYNNQDQTILPEASARLSIKAFFDQIEIPFTDGCYDGTCTGDLCNGNPGKFTYTVDVKGLPKELDSLENYVYSDEETIRITFE